MQGHGREWNRPNGRGVYEALALTRSALRWTHGRVGPACQNGRWKSLHERHHLDRSVPAFEPLDVERLECSPFQLPFVAGDETFTFMSGEEKGVDVRIALDVIRLAHRGEYEVAVLFSQDQDLSEVAEEVRIIADEQRRWLKLACGFPLSSSGRNRRGIDNTDWIRIDRATYDACLDRRDYRIAAQDPGGEDIQRT